MREHDKPRGDGTPVLARREFLKTSATLVVGIGVANAAAAQAPAGVAAPAWQRGLQSGPPDPAAIDSYIAVHSDNTATIYLGYVDLGQGGPTALCQIAVEELDLDFDQVSIVRNDTFMCTNGFTAASRTVGVGGTETRVAAAEARRVLLGLASERLKAPVQDLTVAKGVVSVKGAPGRSVTYGQLLGDKPFERKFETVRYDSQGAAIARTSPDIAPLKPRSEYKVVGTSIPRPDMMDKVRGTYQYVQHVRVEGMLHGRVVWPQGQVAGAISAPKVVSVDESSIKNIPGVRIVRRQNFIGVAAVREWDAVRASRQLKVTWEPFPSVLPGHEGVHDSFRKATTNDLVVFNSGDANAEFNRQGLRVASASYRGPFEGHGTMAPNCAVADIKKDAALVMSSSQGIFQIRDTVAQLTGLPADKVRVQYYPGSNTYGLSCYTDVAEAAAIMSQELGAPVRVQFSRQDEFGWDNFGPAHLAEMRGAVDANGKIVAFEYQAWGYDGNGVGTASRLLSLGAAQGGRGIARAAAAGRGDGAAPGGAAGGGQRGRGAGGLAQGGNSVGGLYQIRLSQNDMYDIPNRRLIEHRLDGREYLKVGPLRAPLDPPYFFAQEGMIDELAYLARLDPYEFRKRNISNSRWLGVLKAATDAAKWTPRVAASTLSSAAVVTGRGIGLGTHHLHPNQGDRITYAAAVVDVEVNKGNGRVVAKHVYGAMDCGLAINPGIVESQIVGMAVHGTSLALREEVQFNRTNVTSLDWNSYQTLRFGEHPAVTPIVVQQLNEKSTGAGEEVLPAVVAAIGNAFFDATGVRLRQFPLTPQRVLAALKSAPTNRRA